ncbi:MAG: hypothetical protein DRG09_03715 [Epsilonproteobacteria bacterium]|nr:MAG: hypothetical protein DRG09_03715 [Campylobacterota bacterium]
MYWVPVGADSHVHPEWNVHYGFKYHPGMECELCMLNICMKPREHTGVLPYISNMNFVGAVPPCPPENQYELHIMPVGADSHVRPWIYVSPGNGM